MYKYILEFLSTNDYEQKSLTFRINKGCTGQNVN